MSRRLAVGSQVQLSSGLIGEVTAIEDCFVKIDSDGAKGKYAKSAICKILKTELKVDERVRTTSGIVGKVVDISDPDIVTILSGDTNLEIDRKAVCEVLPPAAPTKVRVK